MEHNGRIMGKFKYTLSTGQTFVVSAPADATQAQADLIFNQQLQAGALVGLRAGDTILSQQQQLLEFNLSRLDRGTAGVGNLPIVAINNGTPVVSLPLLGNVQVEGINTASFVAQPRAKAVGILTPTQVQGLTAAAAVQPSTTATQETGVGTYGLNSPQLEQTGYLKPGTSCRFMCQEDPAAPNPDNFLSVLKSPAVWTGKDSITSLDALLVNSHIQNKIQQQLILGLPVCMQHIKNLDIVKGLIFLHKNQNKID
jgi:hypothetical protein